MRYFQIRISKHSCLDKVLEEISSEVWKKTKDFLPIGEDSTDFYFRLRKTLTRAVHRRVHKYPNCGLTEACHDEIEGGPWMDYSEKIYMLSLDHDIDGFIDYIANQALNGIVEQLSIKRRLELFSRISTTLRHEFGKYLYFNPVCRAIAFCELQLD
ncbi:hypothetical protein L0152_12930 [bacterium]|nr:hypothetical protein [bacterium]